ncbi:alkene reductase [Bradyrhizobium sp. CCBAU 11361]|uniref:alkene reductase n=1 Tax=Bradyrhizobium sp. CCBAU 11361 TaxID=1630812 RepID=UPI0023040CF9|nr:alkene reductase [Bradyrhizobium sp. CCBAU 11361]MDA9489525.1 NADH:flavin oxidoreductase [Bradyrhizobium sp. CCBAU 11361]
MDKHAEKKLFTPVQVGPLTLKHRVVMPPMSRLRAQPGTGIPSDLQLEYYTQRASNGGLIITEATAIAPSARGYYHAPGLYTDDQIAGWKRITDAVHAKGAYFFTQLWHAGRTTHISITGSEPVTASVDPAYWADTSITVDTPDGFEPTSPHRALETAEIATILEQYRSAAQNAKAAGFDGVELMAANGHLVDQFLQDNTNKRTDQYGGSIENRTRFLAEVVQTLADVWGADRVGVRLAPSGTFNGMGDSDPRALFRHVAERLNDFGLAYLHLIEPRVKGGETIAEAQAPAAAQELSKIFRGPVIAVGGFNPETAEASVANGDASLIAFGRHFIANPDLPKRIELGLPLNPYDRSTFYGYTGRGYTDYPFYEATVPDPLPAA